MSINTITPSWLYEEEGTYIAPRTLTSCIQDEDGNSFQEYADKMIIMSDEETVSMNEDLVTNITNKDIQNIVSDAYDNSKTYAINDYCIKDNILYKCNTTIETAEEFDSSKWTSTNVAKEISDLSNYLYLIDYRKLYQDDYVSFIKMGNTINLVCTIILSSDISAWTRVLNIYEYIGYDYAPKSNFNFVSLQGVCYFQLHTGSFIQSAEALSAGSYYINISWIYQ